MHRPHTAPLGSRLLDLAFALVAGLAFVASFSSCSAVRRELPAGSIELPVDGVLQTELFACGVATVEALTAYHGLELTDDARRVIAERTSVQEGLSGADLRAVLEQAGLEVFLFRGSLDHSATGLWRQLDEGRPLLVAIASAEDRNHYVLLVGYHPPSGDVAVLDPAQGRLVLPAQRFEDCWERAERFTLLALPHAIGAAPTAHIVSVLSPLENRP